MMIDRVTKVVNPYGMLPKRRAARRTATRRKSASNPAHMLTLGFINPKRRKANMAKTKKRRRATASRTRHASAVNRRHRKNPTHRRRSVMIMKERNGYRRKVNPQFLGSKVKPMKMVELVAGGLVGLGVNNLVMTALPATLTSNAFGAVAASAAIALATGYAGGFVDKEFGAAVAFGGLMAAGQIAINQWIPSVGSTIGLSGRGTGDFVSGKFAVPQNPVLDALNGSNSPGGGVIGRAYPSPYAIAA